MDHTNKAGESKVLRECTLPLTGKAVVDRIITNLGVLDVIEGGLRIVELAEDELRAATQASVLRRIGSVADFRLAMAAFSSPRGSGCGFTKFLIRVESA